MINARPVTMTSHTRYCSECKTNPVNTYQITCGDKCRKARQRRRQQARLALPLAMYELGKIRDSLKRGERVQGFREDLSRLKAEINDLLLLAGDEEALNRREMLEGLRRNR